MKYFSLIIINSSIYFLVPNEVKHPKRSFSSDTITSGYSCPSTGPSPEPIANIVDMKSRIQSHCGKPTIVSCCSYHILVSLLSSLKNT